MKEIFKHLAREKQARYFEGKYSVKEFATIKRKFKGNEEAVDILREGFAQMG